MMRTNRLRTLFTIITALFMITTFTSTVIVAEAEAEMSKFRKKFIEFAQRSDEKSFKLQERKHKEK